MQKNLIYSALSLFCCSSLWAADAIESQWRVSVMASELSSSQAGQPWSEGTHAGLGVGVAYTPVPQWDVELTVASQSYVSPYTRFVTIVLPNGNEGQVQPYLVPSTEYKPYRVTPFDLTATRHFLEDQPIAPYVRAGVRYVDAPNDPPPTTTFSGYFPPGNNPVFGVPVTEGFNFDDRISAQLGAGARIRLTPRTALRAEVNRLLRSDGTDFDPLTRYSVGLSWMF